MSPCVLPAVLAADPWVPPRQRAVLTLSPIEREELAWAPGEEKLRAEDAAITPEQRVRRRAQEREIFQRGGIIPLGTGRCLEAEDLVALAASGLASSFVDHYDLLHPCLARHGLAVLPEMLELFSAWPASVMRVVLMRADSTRVARFLLAKDALDNWAQAYPQTAALVLLPAALGPDGEARKAALSAVRKMHRNGLLPGLLSAAALYGPAAVEEVEALFAPAPLPAKAPRLPAFVRPEALPALALADGTPVPAEASLRLLQLATLLPQPCAREALGPTLPALDRARLADLADALLRAWIDAGAAAKEKWALFAVAILGDDRAVRSLAANVEQWSAEGKGPRTRLALEAIAAVGSDVALMHLSFLTRKKGALKKRAAALLDDFREEHGLSEDALADRLVPDLGLDARGTMLFDYGPRSFRAGFDQDLLPFVVDQAGARAASLPRPGKSDDAAKAERARALWDALKKETKGLAADQLRRLERAMAARRDWDRAQFERYFLRHPLMQHVARRLIWGVVDPARGLATTGFRVAEDLTLADADDRPFDLPATARVVVWHPLDMAPQARARFAALLADYTIVQPFPQLGRELFTPTEEELRASKIVRWKGAHVRGERCFTLKHRGWRFLDYDISKPVAPAPGVAGPLEAMLASQPGLGFLGSKPEDQTLGELTLRDGSGRERPFADLSPLAASELFRDVELLLR